MTMALWASEVVTPYKVLKDSYVLIDVERGVIKGFSDKLPSDVKEAEEYPNGIIIPGMIDIHIHGAYGRDVSEGKVEAVLEMAKKLTRHGVTSFLPTVVTSPLSAIKESVRAVREALNIGQKGSRILGVHVEGPYLSVEKAGAEPVAYLRKPNLDEFLELYKISGGSLRRITIAPELEGSLELIREAVGRGVIVSLGHSNATYDEAVRAMDEGALLATHLFNGMRGLHHREPGVVGAFLERDDAYVEVIADLVHLHRATLRLVYKCKGSGRMLLITDSIAATGLPDGIYELGPQKVTVKGGVCRLEDGTLAGSTLTMDRALKNMVKEVGVPLREAVEMATSNPAKLLGLKSLGEVKVGAKADLAVLSRDLEVVATYIEGTKVYASD